MPLLDRVIIAGAMRATMELTPIAFTGDRFADFRPYVAAIDDEGVVAFQAAMAGGGTGVFCGAGGPVTAIALAPGDLVKAVCSHPDLDRQGSASFYADLASGGRGLVLVRDGREVVLAGPGDRFAVVGPLGPTMNGAGAVAFRASSAAGVDGIYLHDRHSITTIADTASRFSGFDGLPCVSAAGAVAFRARRKGGGDGIYLRDGGSLTTIAETGERFAELGRFPTVSAAGTVGFCGTLTSGGAGAFAVTAGALTSIVDPGAYGSCRGVLLGDTGAVVFYATPPGGTIGIYGGPHPGEQRVLGIGDPVYGSTVAGFVLNPVSMNESGHLALRLELADGRQAIVRAARA